MDRLPFDSALDAYERQAQRLLEAHAAGDAHVLEVIRQNHPRYKDPDVPWLSREISEDQIRNAPFDIDDARLVVARSYCFRDWPAVSEYAAAAGTPGSDVHLFETAVEAVINGDAA